MIVLALIKIFMEIKMPNNKPFRPGISFQPGMNRTLYYDLGNHKKMADHGDGSKTYTQWSPDGMRIVRQWHVDATGKQTQWFPRPAKNTEELKK